MTIHRFFVKDLDVKGDEITISDIDIIHQIQHVLRLKIGETVCLFDGSGKEYFGKVKIFLKSFLIFSQITLKSYPQDINKINLYFSIPKKDKAELVLQKCTELGVNSFIPIISNRTEKTNLKKERALIIIKEAAEQSGKVFLPMFHETLELEDALKNIIPEDSIYLDFDLPKIDIKNLQTKNNLNIFVGPEGGFSDKDRELFKKYNVSGFSLGSFILRAETASIAIISALKIN